MRISTLSINNRWTGILGIFTFSVVVLTATTFDLLPLLASCILFLGIVGISYIYPEKMMCAVMVFSIFIPVDLGIIFGSLPRVGPMRGIVAAFLIGVLFHFLQKRGQRRSQEPWPYRKLITAFLLFGVISTVSSISPLKSVYSMASFIFEQFLFFYLFVVFSSDPGFWPRFSKPLFLATAAVCLFAFYEEITHDNFFLSLYPQEESAFRGGILRVRSTFFHPIALGCYLSMIFPLLLVEVIENDRKRERLLFMAVLVLVTITLFLTISRGPWIAVLIQLALFSIWWGRRNLHRALLAGLAAAALLLLLVVAGMNSDLSGNTMGRMLNPSGITLGKMDLKNIDESSSEFYRFALVKAVVESLQGERWIYGYGPGTFFLADVESTYAGHTHINIAPDSHYLKLLFEQGIPGLTLFVLLLAVIGLECVRVVRDPRCGSKLFALGGFAAILGFIFENTTVSMFSISLPLNLMFWMTVAMVHNCGKIRR